jgi:hypothetical protein
MHIKPEEVKLLGFPLPTLLHSEMLPTFLSVVKSNARALRIHRLPPTNHDIGLHQ